MLRTRFKNAVVSVIIITTGIGIPVAYHTYNEGEEQKQKHKK